LAYLPTSPFCGSNSTISPHGYEAWMMPFVTAADASICATLAI
jgi:hypothetical protein